MSETVSEREVQADNETGTDLQIQNTSKKKHQWMTQMFHWIRFKHIRTIHKRFKYWQWLDNWKFHIRPESQLLVRSHVVKQNNFVKNKAKTRGDVDGD